MSNRRFNADGYLLTGLHSRSQLFRDGRLEGVMSEIVYPHDQLKVLRVMMCEKSLFATVRGYLKFFKAVGLKLPLWAFGAIAGCEGVHVAINAHWHHHSEETIDRPVAFLPSVELASFDIPLEAVLRPICDAIWQSAGVERSMNYDENGCWQERR